jgi:signal transduction histidine kinase
MLSWLSSSSRFRSLHAQAILRIVLPLSLILAGLVVASTYNYNRIVTSLIVERHHQLAGLAAASVSEVIEGYASVLDTLASKHRLLSRLPEERLEALQEAEDVFDIFDAGVLIVDKQGLVITTSRDNSIPYLLDISISETFQSVRDRLVPSFSNVLFDEGANDAFILIAVPLFDAEEQFAGAVIGGIDVHSTSISKPIRNLTIGRDGFTYMIDRGGIIMAHPDPHQIGADYSNLPFVKRVVAGENGGMVTETSNGKRQVESYAPIGTTGWGLVIQESWESVTEPVGLFGVLITAIELAVIILVVILLWWGFDRIAVPIQTLHDQINNLAKGKNIEPIKESGIDEIDALESAFLTMATQIASYRSGLHRYVGEITKAQEEERRRIARELHDETMQNLIALSRRMEIYQTSEDKAQRRAQIAELREIVSQTLEGIRRINRELRPLILEDLGLIPALQSLVRDAGRGEGASPHAKFDTKGQQHPMNPEQELALYRITQEALANIRKHAQATGVLVELSFLPKTVRLEIADNGKGFEVRPSLTDFAQMDSFGLLGIQERVWAAGGTLSIQSSPGHGTKLSVTVPIMGPNPGN